VPSMKYAATIQTSVTTAGNQNTAVVGNGNVRSACGGFERARIARATECNSALRMAGNLIPMSHLSGHRSETIHGSYAMSSEKLVHRVSDDSGHVVEEYETRDGAIDGYRKIWSSHGALLGEAQYRDGKLEGGSREWNENGQLVRECNYAGGELHGEYKAWWDNGKPKEVGAYDSGRKVGRYTWYKEDGTVWQSLDLQ
jgi:MORN repeat variant